MRSSFRASIHNERGIALIAVLLLAILYFALIEMVLFESTEAYRSAQRFRSRVIANALVESGAELAAQQLADAASSDIKADTAQGKIVATMTRPVAGEEFEIKAEATTYGVQPMHAHVVVRGRTVARQVIVERTVHSY